MDSLTPLLAHAGPGSTWQAMVVVVSVGLVVVFLLTVLGRLVIARLDDLVLPLAAVAIVSSLAPLADEWLSDWIGWAFPVGAVMLAALLLAAATPLELAPDGMLSYAAAGLAVAGAVVLHQPLTVAWHPPPDLLPAQGDAQVAIVAPLDGATVEAGDTTVEVAITGGSIGPGGLAFDDLPADAEEAGALDATVDGDRVPVQLEQECSRDEPCTEVSFPVRLEPGDVRLRVEFTRGDGMPFAPSNVDTVEITVE
jgi:hypothetical protein